MELPIANKELEIVQNAQINQIFQILNLSLLWVNSYAKEQKCKRRN